MEPSNKLFLPLIALLLPLTFYFFLGSVIAPYLTTFGISNDILLAVLGFAYLCVIFGSHHEGRSQSKYFKKYQKNLELPNPNDTTKNDVTKSSQKRYGTCFFINVIAILIALGIWIFSSENMIDKTSTVVGVENIWYQIVFLIVIMFICSNIFRITASIILFKIKFDTAIYSLKFVMLEEIFLYGLVISYILFIGGFFV